jgi:hypothetical protein
MTTLRREKTKIGLVGALAMAFTIILAPMIYAQATTIPNNVTEPTPPAASLQTQQQSIIDTQQLQENTLTESLRTVDGLLFHTRWGDTVNVNPEEIAVLFADCKPGEFLTSEQHIFMSDRVSELQSFPVSTPQTVAGDEFVTWIMIVKNTDHNDQQIASLGVICVSDSGEDTNGVDFDQNVKTQINNVVKQFIKIENGQIINLQQIINIHNSIVQNITQIANNTLIINNSTISNSTISQIINQSATQIVASNGSNIEETVNQTASAIAINEKGKPALAETEQPSTNTTESTTTEEESATTLAETLAAPPATEEESKQPPADEESSSEGDPVPGNPEPPTPNPNPSETTTTEEPDTPPTSESDESEQSGGSEGGDDEATNLNPSKSN